MNTTEKIISLIQQKNITVFTLEKELGLSNASVAAWKKGKAKPSTDALVKIAKYFNVSTDYLLGLIDNPDKEKSSASVEDSLEVEMLYNQLADMLKANPEKQKLFFSIIAKIAEAFNEQ